MKLWRWLLVFMVVAAVAAFGWHWVAADPGQVLIRIRGWRLETTLMVFVVLLLIVWVLLALALKLIRWPFAAVPRQRQRLAHKRLAAGVIGLYEGHAERAHRKLLKASRYAPLRASAQLLEADAASRRGDVDDALARLDEAATQAPRAARVLRARILRESGDADEAARLLDPRQHGGRMPPAAWHELVRARLEAGDARQALDALPPLRKSGALDDDAMRALEQKTLAAALDQCVDADERAELWAGLKRVQRRQPALIGVHVRNAARHGDHVTATRELKSALRGQWDSELAALYVGLADDPEDKRLRQGEKWLREHPDDALLLASLGVLCARQDLEGKARHYLEQAVELDPQLAPAWAALGDITEGEGDQGGAAEFYRKALGVALGDDQHQRLNRPHRVLATVVEQRNQHGVPQLPDGELRAEDEGA